MRPSATCFLLLALSLPASLEAAPSSPVAPDQPPPAVQLFGKLPDGTPIHLFTLRNHSGIEARVMNYGAALVSLSVPDRNGIPGDIILGYDALSSYLSEGAHFGAVIGRCANRIKAGRFVLDGKPYQLAANFRGHHLHGGVKGIDTRFWSASFATNAATPSLTLTYTSPDGEEGYPGRLAITAVYTLSESNELSLELTATSDKPTLCNLTHHPYFNLTGSGDVLAHRLTLLASSITEVDPEMIPTGRLLPVAGTPLDFTRAVPLGSVINATHAQMKIANGFDHNWVYTKRPGTLTLMARVEDPASGRIMEILSTEPGLQFYSPDFGDGCTCQGGQLFKHRGALCLEPQHYPDAPNQPGFPSIVLRPGETYRNVIVYRFSNMGE